MCFQSSSGLRVCKHERNEGRLYIITIDFTPGFHTVLTPNVQDESDAQDVLNSKLKSVTVREQMLNKA